MTAPGQRAVVAVWDGVFPTWEDACAASSGVDATFAGDRWLARMTAQLETYRGERARHGHAAAPPRPTNLPWAAALARPEAILDFGGSSGWSWDVLVSTVPDLAVRSFTIVEHPAVVRHMRASGLHRPPVAYATADESLAACDLLYCNSVLQYFKDNAPLLDLVARTRPARVLLDDVLVGDAGDWFSLQRNYDVTIPHRFLGWTTLTDDLRRAGYELRLRVPHPSPIRGVVAPLPMDNLPEACRIQHASSALFERMPWTAAAGAGR